MSAPTLALVGCGAIADFFHLPALRRRPEILKNLVLVDPNIGHAQRLRQELGASNAVADHREIMGQVDGAIIATPHHLHYPITLDFVNQGVHVLSEKPLASTAKEVDTIIGAARSTGVHVAVNHTRRLFTSFQEVRRIIDSGDLGEVTEIDYELGEPFEWPAATDTYFGAKAGGRGVLYDTGAHIIDLVCWWMGAEPELVAYRDDSHGGTEAVAHVTLRRGATTAHIHLSWLSKLRNAYRVVGSGGSIEGGAYEWSSYSRVDSNGKARKVKTDRARTFDDFADKLLGNFIDAICGRSEPITSAADARASIAVIDACYAQREQIPLPWHTACEALIHV